jgi:predicted O-linked N-acetylglucosamine transferase (SPINDLY family)
MMLCAGLSDWVANDVEQYVAIAVKYANNIPNLERIRKSLRRQVLQSPLFDAPAFAKNLETSLRAMVLDKLGGH